MEDNEIKEEQRLQAGQQVQPEQPVEAGGQVLSGKVAETGQPYKQEQAAQPVEQARQEAYEKRAKKPWLKPLAIALIAIAIAGGCFVGGMKYGESRETPPAAASMPSVSEDGQTMPTQPGGPMGGEMQGGTGAMGEVTAISSSSISIEDVRSGEESTYCITSATEILDNDEAAKVGDIEVGDTVMVIASSTDSDQAEQIMINPSMGGPGGQGYEPPSS